MNPTPGSAPGAFARPFAPKPAGTAAPGPSEPEWQAPRLEEPPAAIAPDAPSAGRRTPRMLAALVEEDQVSLWPVEPGAEPAGPQPNELSFLSVDEPAAGTPRTGWGIESSLAPSIQPPDEPVAADAPAEDDLFDRLAHSLPEARPFDTPPLPGLERPPEAPVDPPASRSFAAEPEWSTDSRTRAVEALEAMARRVRNGEIVLPQGPSLGSDAALLAAVLTALLEGRD